MYSSYKFLIVSMIANIVSHIYELKFYFLVGKSLKLVFLILMNFNLSVFSFSCLCSKKAKKTLPKPKSQIFTVFF